MTGHTRIDRSLAILYVAGLALLAVLAAIGVQQIGALADVRALNGSVAVGLALAESRPLPVEGSTSAVQMVLPSRPPVRIDEQAGAIVFYFSGDHVQLPADAANALGAIVRGVAVGQTAVIRGYGRSTDDPVQVEQQTRVRMLAVHNLLISVGIGEGKIRRAELEQPPAWMPASQADRVEVVLESD